MRKLLISLRKILVTAPPTGVTLLNPQFQTNSFVLSFQSEAGRTYTVESSPDLSSWGSSGVAPAAGNGGVLVVPIPMPTASRTFYRVKSE